MTAVQIMLLVVGILGVQGIAWILAVRWIRRRSSAVTLRLTRELEATGERARRGPEPAAYRGGTGGFSRIKGNCVLALTDRRLVFAKLVGAPVEVATADIVEVREEKWFLRAYVGSQTHVVVRTRAGEDVGFFARDREAWLAELRAIASADAGATAS